MLRKITTSDWTAFALGTAMTLAPLVILGMAEIGRTLGRSEEAAKKLVQRGLAELRQRLGHGDR